MQDYYQVDGKPLGERNSKWLQDDYVKFIRFGQWNVQQAEIGILAMITNHGYLDNPTFRGMRQQLSQAFNKIYLLDLHGNTKKKEVAPDGTKDENVFDITQGVAICLMAKFSGKQKVAQVSYLDLFGLRENKYNWLGTRGNLLMVSWGELHLSAPFYFYKHQDEKLRAEYENGFPIQNAMPKYANGLFTARDNLTIHFSEDEVIPTVKDFVSLNVEKARSKYDLGDDVRDWKVKFAQDDLKSSPISTKNVKRILYRPFDIRYTYYTGQSRGFHCMPRPEIMRHMIDGNNLALNIGRAGQNIDLQSEWDLVFCTNSITDLNLYRRGGNILLPLFIYEDLRQKKQTTFLEETGKVANFDNNFLNLIKTKTGLRIIYDDAGDLHETVSPENILHYIYAVFYSPSFRERYSEFLRRDYPRVPITSDVNLFCKLSTLGEELVDLHLLKSRSLNKTTSKFSGKGDNVVAKGYPKYQESMVFINPNQGFGGISEEIWEFHVGGYQICEKWLKDRREKELSKDDIVIYQKIIVALKETIRLMGEVDDAIESAGGLPLR